MPEQTIVEERLESKYFRDWDVPFIAESSQSGMSVNLSRLRPLFFEQMPVHGLTCEDMVNPNSSVSYMAHVKGLTSFIRNTIGGDPARVKLLPKNKAKCKRLRITVNSVHINFLER